MDRIPAHPIVQFVRDRYGARGDLRVTLTALRGGLEASAVARARVSWRDGAKIRAVRFVVKQLAGAAVREVEIYRALARGSRRSPFLGAVPSEGGVLLFLEWLRPAHRWPWPDLAITAEVLTRLAHVHRTEHTPPLSSTWDFETELAASAAATVESLERFGRGAGVRDIVAAARATRRVVARLPALRRHLTDCSTFGRVFVHGDVHSGNVIVTRGGPVERVVLVDWSRARMGSALEDVSSLTQSLGCWVPEVRQKHDTLLMQYLRAFGTVPRLDDDFRAKYWLAGACNAFAGALSYRLWRLEQSGAGTPEHDQSLAAAAGLIRAVRRADEYWS